MIEIDHKIVTVWGQCRYTKTELPSKLGYVNTKKKIIRKKISNKEAVRIN